MLAGPSTIRNIRLTLAYDGSHYCGWQVQPHRPSIQSVLEAAIEKLTGAYSSLLSAGRTDAGVHALGQVASFHTACPIPGPKFRPALQAHLPEDIVIRDSEEVPAEFHATFSARRKRYRYVIYNDLTPLPFLRQYAYHLRRRLDVPAMQAAANMLIGTHDFRSFETDWPNKATSVRTVELIEFRRAAGWWPWHDLAPASPPAGELADPPPQNRETGHPFILMDIQADGFLYNMVRSIMGTLIHVGCGKWTDNDVRRILADLNRSSAGNTAPAHGLYLVNVDYSE